MFTDGSVQTINAPQTGSYARPAGSFKSARPTGEGARPGFERRTIPDSRSP